MWCWRQHFTMAGGMQLLAPRVAQGSRKCEGVQQWRASFLSLSQMAYSACLLPSNLRKSFWLALDLDQPIVNDKWLRCSSLFGIQVTNHFQDLPQQQSKLQLQLDQELHACREIQDCTAALLPFIGQFHFLQVAWRPHSFACGDQSFLVVFFPWGLWKLSYRTYCRLSQGLSTQQRGILNCDYFWRYIYTVMYHYVFTTVRSFDGYNSALTDPYVFISMSSMSQNARTTPSIWMLNSARPEARQIRSIRTATAMRRRGSAIWSKRWSLNGLAHRIALKSNPSRWAL